MSVFNDVKAFHEAMDIPVLPEPRFPAYERVILRLDLIMEELEETLLAIDTDDLVGTADGFVDMLYVIVGAMHEFGLPAQALWDEVHRANMAKKGGPIREDGKRLKPPGWTPPDIAGILEEASRVACGCCCPRCGGSGGGVNSWDVCGLCSGSGRVSS